MKTPPRQIQKFPRRRPSLIQVLLLVGISSQVFASAERPNIVWLVTEDNSPFLGCYGDDLAVTPRLDALAANGVLFSGMYANAPVCAPSRSTLIHGVHANSLGTHHMRCSVPIPDSFQQVPWYLKNSGYYTTNRAQKDDYNTPQKNNPWDNFGYWTWSDAFKGRQADQPFFLMYNTWMNHEGKIHQGKDAVTRDYMRSTLQAFFPLSKSDAVARAQQYWNDYAVDPDAVQLPAYHPDLPEIRSDWAKYYRLMAWADMECGWVLDGLKDLGLMDSTIVFYFSDHGGVLPRSKRFLYESGLHTPFIVHVPEAYPEIKAKLQALKDTTVSFVDIAATTLDLAGIAIPPHFDGESLLNKDPENQLAFAFRGRMDERSGCVRSVTDGKFRFTRNYIPHYRQGGHIRFLWKTASTQAWESHYMAGLCNPEQAQFWEPDGFEALFDIQSDPDNVINLIDDPVHAQEAIRLRSALDSWMVEIKDVGLIPEPMMVRLAGNASPYDWARTSGIDWANLVQVANHAADPQRQDISFWVTLSEDPNPVYRYWATLALSLLDSCSDCREYTLLSRIEDEYPTVVVTAAEGLYRMGRPWKARDALNGILADYPDWRRLNKNYQYGYEDYILTLALNIIDRYEQFPGSYFPSLQDYTGLEHHYSSWLADEIAGVVTSNPDNRPIDEFPFQDNPCVHLPVTEADFFLDQSVRMGFGYYWNPFLIGQEGGSGYIFAEHAPWIYFLDGQKWIYVLRMSESAESTGYYIYDPENSRWGFTICRAPSAGYAYPNYISIDDGGIYSLIGN